MRLWSRDWVRRRFRRAPTAAGPIRSLSAARALRFGLAIVLLLWALYAVAVTAFLQLGGVQKILGSTDQVTIGFRRAWSLWPGRIHVEDLLIVAQDHNVQFSLGFPSVDVDVRLRELPSRTFHATRVRGDGLSFRFRHRVNPETASAPWVAAYPPIPGMADPPLLEAGVESPPVDEAHYRLWTVHIENVDVGVREIWAQMARYQGEARVRGAFRLRPALHLWVGPGELRFDAGSVSVGSAEALRDFRGSLTCTVDPFDVRTVVGMEPFQFISARAALSAELAGLEVSSHFTPAFELLDGSGPLDMDIALDHGVLAPDSAMKLRAVHVGWKGDGGGLDASGDLAVLFGGANAHRDLFAVREDEAGDAHVAIDVPVASVSIADSKISPLELRHAGAFFSSTTADVTRPWKRAAAVVRLEAAKLDDLRWLRDAPIGHLSMFEGGHGEVSGRFALTGENVVDLSASARVDQARMRIASSQWEGSGLAKVEVDDRARRADAHLDLRQVRATATSLGASAERVALAMVFQGRAEETRFEGPVSLDLEAAGLELTRAGMRITGQASAVVAGQADRPSTAIENLTGRIQLRDVGVTVDDRKVDGWWADVALKSTRLSAAHGFDATGSVEARLRDGLPALYMLASSDDIPKFVPSLLPLSGLKVALAIDRHCRFTDVRILEASGGPVAAAGRLQFDPEKNSGAVLVYTSPVALASIGLELREHSSHVSPMVGTGWLTERLGPLARLASEKRLAYCVSQPGAHR